MRSVIGLIATGLAGIAAVVASQGGDVDFVPFFVALTVAGGTLAAAAHEPSVPAPTFAGFDPTLFYLVGLYGGVILVILAAFARLSSTLAGESTEV